MQANNRVDWEIIIESFRSVGYTLNFRVLDAADYGTPQHRERLILVGVRDDIAMSFLFPAPSHGPSGYISTDYVKPADAIRDIDDPSEVVPPYGGKYGDLLNDIPPGQNYSFYTERMGHPRPLFAWRSKFSGFLYKIDPNFPSKTIVAHQGRYDGPFHWKNRKLNVSELKRIQVFPDGYIFVDSKVEAIRQIGNSVAPKMANNLALAVANQIFGFEQCLVPVVKNSDELDHSKRKAVKASATKRKTHASPKIAVGQLNFFSEVPTFTKSLECNSVFSFKEQTFQIHEVLKNGKWTINVNTESNHPTTDMKLSLSFSNPVGCEFNQIEARIRSESALGSGLIPYNQKMTVTAMAMADMKTSAHLS